MCPKERHITIMHINGKERKKPWIATKRGRNVRRKSDDKLIKPYSNKTSSGVHSVYKSSEWRATREAVLTRDGLCVWCLHLGKVTEPTECDHVVPLQHCEAEGIHPLDQSNLVASCRSCNSRRAAYEGHGVYFTTIKEWVDYLRKKHIENKRR